MPHKSGLEMVELRELKTGDYVVGRIDDEAVKGRIYSIESGDFPTDSEGTPSIYSRAGELQIKAKLPESTYKDAMKGIQTEFRISGRKSMRVLRYK